MKHMVKAPKTAKNHSDLDLDKLENEIPDLARIATREAYINTIKSGRSVMQVVDSMLCEVFSNGTKKIIKKIEPNRVITTCRKFHLKQR